jgi:YtcA-like protein
MALFPSWIVCLGLGILLAVGVRWLFVRFGIENDIKPTILIYPCLSLSFALTAWLTFFR